MRSDAQVPRRSSLATRCKRLGPTGISHPSPRWGGRGFARCHGRVAMPPAPGAMPTARVGMPSPPRGWVLTHTSQNRMPAPWLSHADAKPWAWYPISVKSSSHRSAMRCSSAAPRPGVDRSGTSPSRQWLEAPTAERSKQHHAAERRDEEGISLGSRVSVHIS